MSNVILKDPPTGLAAQRHITRHGVTGGADGHVKYVVRELVQNSMDAFATEIRFYVFERDAPYKYKDMYKDGIHIMIKGVILDKYSHYKMREDLIIICKMETFCLI